MALNKKNRVKNKRDFDRVFKEGKAVRSSFLFIKFTKNDLGFNRFGFVVSSKVAKKATDRNRIKRAMSETVRRLKDVFEVAYDVIIVATPGVGKLMNKDLDLNLAGLFKKANLIR